MNKIVLFSLIGFAILVIIIIIIDNKTNSSIYNDFNDNRYNQQIPNYRNTFTGTGVSTLVLNWPSAPIIPDPTIFTTPTDYNTYVSDKNLWNYYTRLAVEKFSSQFPKKPIDQFSSYWYFVPMGV